MIFAALLALVVFVSLPYGSTRAAKAGNTAQPAATQPLGKQANITAEPAASAATNAARTVHRTATQPVTRVAAYEVSTTAVTQAPAASVVYTDTDQDEGSTHPPEDFYTTDAIFYANKDLESDSA